MIEYGKLKLVVDDSVSLPSYVSVTCLVDGYCRGESFQPVDTNPVQWIRRLLLLYSGYRKSHVTPMFLVFAVVCLMLPRRIPQDKRTPHSVKLSEPGAVAVKTRAQPCGMESSYSRHDTQRLTPPATWQRSAQRSSSYILRGLQA